MADTTFGAELYDSALPLAYGDADHDDAFLILCDAIGTMAAQLELLTRVDEDDHDPWSVILDAERAPGYMLPYLAQFVGQTIPVGTPDDAARDMIRSPSNQERGTAAKMIHDAKATLTGSQYVRLIERDGSPFRFSVIVRTSECPDPAATEAAILASKPAGLALNFAVVAGTTISELTGSINSLSGTIDGLS